MTEPVLFERKGAVAYLTLNRPDEGNSINVALARALLAAAIAAEADDGVRCVVLRGAGRMFCAGGDVKALHAAGEALSGLVDEILVSLHPAISRLACMGKPVITAIHGAAAGAGLGLALVGDMVLAEPGAHFTTAYSKIGLSPDGGATWLLPRLVGLRLAQYLLLTSRRVSAVEALSIGLVTRVVEQGALEREVETLAGELAASAVSALGRTKRLLLSGADANLGAQLEAEREGIARQACTKDARIGLAALVERRKPNFEA